MLMRNPTRYDIRTRDKRRICICFGLAYLRNLGCEEFKTIYKCLKIYVCKSVSV